MVSSLRFQKPTVYLFIFFLIKIILFALKIYFLQQKTPKVSQKIRILVTFLYFQV